MNNHINVQRGRSQVRTCTHETSTHNDIIAQLMNYKSFLEIDPCVLIKKDLIMLIQY